MATVIVVPLVMLVSFSLVSGIQLSLLLADLGVSLWRIGVALVIAAILGWLGAILLTAKGLGELFLPVFDLLQSVPSFAILPIAILYFGRTDWNVIFFLVLSIIWPILFTTMNSIKQSDRDWRDAMTMSRVGLWDYLRLYLIPLSLPGFITGCVIGLGDGWEALIATEIIVALPSGVGAFFTAVANNPALTAFGVLMFLSIIFAINKLVFIPLLEWSHRYAN
jgi:ABC-type nitrate/sulfonate/bicarbonate transport system permease component